MPWAHDHGSSICTYGTVTGTFQTIRVIFDRCRLKECLQARPRSVVFDIVLASAAADECNCKENLQVVLMFRSIFCLYGKYLKPLCHLSIGGTIGTTGGAATHHCRHAIQDVHDGLLELDFFDCFGKNVSILQTRLETGGAACLQLLKTKLVVRLFCVSIVLVHGPKSAANSWSDLH